MANVSTQAVAGTRQALASLRATPRSGGAGSHGNCVPDAQGTTAFPGGLAVRLPASRGPGLRPLRRLCGKDRSACMRFLCSFVKRQLLLLVWDVPRGVCVCPLAPRCLGSLELRERPLLGQPRVGGSFGTKCSVCGRTTRASAPRSRAASTQRRGHCCHADTAATPAKTFSPSLWPHGAAPESVRGPLRAQRASCGFTPGTPRLWVRPELDGLGFLRAVCLGCSVRYSCSVFPLKAAVALLWNFFHCMTFYFFLKSVFKILYIFKVHFFFKSGT